MVTANFGQKAKTFDNDGVGEHLMPNGDGSIITLNLNIFGKDNIVCVSLVNAIMYLNLIGETNVPKVRNCT
jgi:hypothetical protein